MFSLFLLGKYKFEVGKKHCKFEMSDLQKLLAENVYENEVEVDGGMIVNYFSFSL